MDESVWRVFVACMDLATEAPFLPASQMINDPLRHSVPPFASIVDNLYMNIVVPSVVFHIWDRMEER